MKSLNLWQNMFGTAAHTIVTFLHTAAGATILYGVYQAYQKGATWHEAIEIVMPYVFAAVAPSFAGIGHALAFGGPQINALGQGQAPPEVK